MQEKLTDDQLVELFRLDKHGGFRTIMYQYQEKVYWHIRRMVTIHEDADDVLQNTFVKVYKNLDAFEGKSKIYTWIYRIATNESLTFLKSRNRKRTESLEDNDTVFIQLKADQYFDGNDAQIILQKAILTLPQKQKTVFNLRYYEEMSYKEMSDILETSVGALKASYHHAVKKIEDFIKK